MKRGGGGHEGGMVQEQRRVHQKQNDASYLLKMVVDGAYKYKPLNWAYEPLTA